MGEPSVSASSSLDNSTAIDSVAEDSVEITNFTEDVHDVALHFQIVRLQKQGNSVNFASLLGGGSDNVGSSIARRIVMKTGMNAIIACNIPKDSPMLEARAERKLVEKLKKLGYVKG